MPDCAVCSANPPHGVYHDGCSRVFQPPRRERYLSDRNRCEVPPRSCFGGVDGRRCDAADLYEEYNALALRKLRGEAADGCGARATG